MFLLASCMIIPPSIIIEDKSKMVEDKVISPTHTRVILLPTVTSTPFPTVGVPTIEPTPTVTVLPTATSILLEGVYTDGTINGKSMLKELQILRCSDSCNMQEVTDLISYQEDSWKIAQDIQMLYAHSGRFTNLPWDREFGEELRQLYLENSLQDTLICFNTSTCLEVVDVVVGEYTDRSISSFELFPNMQNASDFVLVICIEPTNRYSSERLFILLRMRV